MKVADTHHLHIFSYDSYIIHTFWDLTIFCYGDYYDYYDYDVSGGSQSVTATTKPNHPQECSMMSPVTSYHALPLGWTVDSHFFGASNIARFSLHVPGRLYSPGNQTSQSEVALHP